jgi:hypothetical protein
MCNKIPNLNTLMLEVIEIIYDTSRVNWINV